MNSKRRTISFSVLNITSLSFLYKRPSLFLIFGFTMLCLVSSFRNLVCINTCVGWPHQVFLYFLYADAYKSLPFTMVIYCFSGFKKAIIALYSESCPHGFLYCIALWHKLDIPLWQSLKSCSQSVSPFGFS